jgi:hypothetical protein
VKRKPSWYDRLEDWDLMYPPWHLLVVAVVLGVPLSVLFIGVGALLRAWWEGAP